VQPLASVGRLYALTNDADTNAVAVFNRASDGSVVPLGGLVPLTGLPATFGPAFGYGAAPTFPTGGRGTGSALLSQGSVVSGGEGRFLFAVNAGSNDVSSFLVTADGLRRVSTVPSGGLEPRSLTVHGDLLYVANGLGTGTIAGFRVGVNGELSPLPTSVRPLPSPDSAPVQISFTPDGSRLVVTELFADRISVFSLGPDGLSTGVLSHASAGESPFGFAFTSGGFLVVSESFGFRADQSAVSTYELNSTGDLHVVSASVPTEQGAACWIANTPDGRFTYTTNTGSGSVSGYRVAADGELTPLSGDGRTGITGSLSFPVDAVVSRDGKVLHVLAQGRQTLAAFRIESDGQLTPGAGTGGLPPLALGLATG